MSKMQLNVKSFQIMITDVFIAGGREIVFWIIN